MIKLILYMIKNFLESLGRYFLFMKMVFRKPEKWKIFFRQSVNEADKLMVPFRSWLNLDELRKKEELYAAGVQANPMGIEARILDDVQKQIALLEKAEK